MSRPAAAADVFLAVSDPTRRSILQLLAEGERAVMWLVERFRISQPAISKHLRVLREAGLVSRRRDGRQQLYRLEANELRAVGEWVAYFEKFWDERLDALGRYLDEQP
ncbi:MAG: transcriptional regulator [Planctomycetes bacterium]|nr:transcriptional regulator [Planctomycetota bacterium]